ncbi:hypothetical protein [Methanopyrus sp. KOL6]|uniref:hypothetical protein n=1 Tax=Methanopyrus sp. KOL6 TaxID=1937004 RepID=UPI0012FB8A2A|nr:hypothetical protein [Methanopyrus sp. KOL6]
MIPYYSKNKKEIIISNEPTAELKLENDKLSVIVDGETIDTIRLDPNHVYAYMYMIGESGGIPIVPDIEHNCYVPANLLIIKNSKVYVFYHLFSTDTTIPIPENIITTQVVGIDFGEYLKGGVYQPDFILGVDHQGDIIVFYVYRSSSKEFFKLYCDLSSGRVWRGSPSSEELEKLKNLANRVDEEEFWRPERVGMNILYDMDDDKVIMVVWNARVRDIDTGSIDITGVIKECNPRLYEFVEFLNSVGSLYDSYSSWNYFELCAKAFEFKDLLEELGLIESKPVRLLLHPWLLPSAYVITSIPYLMTSLACSILLERLWKPKIPLIVLFELPSISHYIADWTSKLLAKVWLGDDKLASKVWDDVSVGVGVPVIWEPLKRLVVKITRLPKLLIDQCYILMESIYKLTYKEKALSKSRALPLLIGTLLHSLYDSGISLDNWTSLLRPILSTVGGVIISIVTGLK